MHWPGPPAGSRPVEPDSTFVEPPREPARTRILPRCDGRPTPHDRADPGAPGRAAPGGGAHARPQDHPRAGGGADRRRARPVRGGRRGRRARVPRAPRLRPGAARGRRGALQPQPVRARARDRRRRPARRASSTIRDFAQVESVRELRTGAVLCMPIRTSTSDRGDRPPRAPHATGTSPTRHRERLRALLEVAGPVLEALQAGRKVLRRARPPARLRDPAPQRGRGEPQAARDRLVVRALRRALAPRCASSRRRCGASPATDFPVLLLGETGTGKSILARVIHYVGPRAAQPFVTVFCPSLEKGMVEAELFGHRRGAFTGALRRPARQGAGGRRRARCSSTRSASCRSRSSRSSCACSRRRRTSASAIPRSAASTCGSSRRPIATSSTRSREGRFRRDLYERLNYVPVRVPPLRERVEDIPLLLRHALDQHELGPLGRALERGRATACASSTSRGRATCGTSSSSRRGCRSAARARPSRAERRARAARSRSASRSAGAASRRSVVGLAVAARGGRAELARAGAARAIPTHARGAGRRASRSASRRSTRSCGSTGSRRADPMAPARDDFRPRASSPGRCSPAAIAWSSASAAAAWARSTAPRTSSSASRWRSSSCPRELGRERRAARARCSPRCGSRARSRTPTCAASTTSWRSTALHFLSMEFVDGEDLASLLRRIGRLPADKAVEIAREICAGLARHPRPRRAPSRPQARERDDRRARPRAHHRLRAGRAAEARPAIPRRSPARPPTWRPRPRRRTRAHRPSDLYSLGLVLYELFTGQPAFEAATLRELIRLRARPTPARPVPAPARPRPADRARDPALPRARSRAPPAVGARGGGRAARRRSAGGGDRRGARRRRPELVAAAHAARRGLAAARSRGAASWRSSLGFALVTVVSPRTRLVPALPLPEPPDAMAGARARWCCASTAPPRLRSTARSATSSTSPRSIASWRPTARPRAGNRSRDVRPPVVTFWYRESPRGDGAARAVVPRHLRRSAVARGHGRRQARRARAVSRIDAPSSATLPLANASVSARAPSGTRPIRPRASRGCIRRTCGPRCSSRVMFIGAWLARRNLRAGRGDTKRAVRVACAMMALRILIWLLGGHHTARLGHRADHDGARVGTLRLRVRLALLHRDRALRAAAVAAHAHVVGAPDGRPARATRASAAIS